MHHREWKATTNTSRLLALITESCVIYKRGAPRTQIPIESILSMGLSSEKRNPFFLFPSETALPLTRENLNLVFKNDLPFSMIVPDGSWRQAQKVYKREKDFQTLALFKIPETSTLSQYHLRKEPRPDGLATFEAIAKAIGIIEGPNIEEKLLGFFKEFVRRTLLSRQGKFDP
jgi:DTW domain-containing protein YfiP